MSKTKTKLIPEEISRFHSDGIYVPARLIDCMDDITEEKAKQVVKNIRLLDFVSDEDITVLLATEGGDVSWGMQIYDALKECVSKVVIQIVGPCWSMGSIIAQAGDHIKISQNATMMIHMGQQNYPEDHILNIERWVKENKRVGEIADNVLFEKMQEKDPTLTKKRFTNLIVFDKIYSADEAVEIGLANEITDHNEFWPECKVEE